MSSGTSLRSGIFSKSQVLAIVVIAKRSRDQSVRFGHPGTAFALWEIGVSQNTRTADHGRGGAVVRVFIFARRSHFASAVIAITKGAATVSSFFPVKSIDSIFLFGCGFSQLMR